jgi:antitoxin MazE
MIYIMTQCISEEVAMKVSKWGNSLAIRIPADVAERLGFAEGDQVKIEAKEGKLVAEREKTIEEMWARFEEIRKKIQWPADYKFDRDEANSRD